jgi:hypothetical protein
VAAKPLGIERVSFSSASQSMKTGRLTVVFDTLSRQLTCFASRALKAFKICDVVSLMPDHFEHISVEAGRASIATLFALFAFLSAMGLCASCKVTQNP